MLRKLLPATGVIWALRAPKIGKSVQEFLGPLGRGAQKIENGVEKESKSTVSTLLTCFRLRFQLFGFQGERPRQLIFGRFFQLWVLLQGSNQMTPVSIQHVLTVLVFWCQVLLVPGLPAACKSFTDCAPQASNLLPPRLRGGCAPSGIKMTAQWAD